MGFKSDNLGFFMQQANQFFRIICRNKFNAGFCRWKGKGNNLSKRINSRRLHYFQWFGACSHDPRILGIRASAIPFWQETTSGRFTSATSSPPSISRVTVAVVPARSNFTARLINGISSNSATIPPMEEPL